MTVSDPSLLLSEIELDTWSEYKRLVTGSEVQEHRVEYEDVATVEPNFAEGQAGASSELARAEKCAELIQQRHKPITSRVTRLGSFIDTDAVRPC